MKFTGVLFVFMLSMLAACGGGSGGSGDTHPTTAASVARFVYVTNRDDDTISIFSIDTTSGRLRSHGHAIAGDEPRSVAVDPSGRFVYVGNFRSNDVSAYRVQASGAVTPIGRFATGRSPSSVAVDPAGRFVYVTNEGELSVEPASIAAYTIQADGALAPIDANLGTPAIDHFPARPGVNSGTIEENGRFLYTVNRGDPSLSFYEISVTGALRLVEVTPVTPDFNPFAMFRHPSGRFAYVTDRNGAGRPGVAVYAIQSDGRLVDLGASVAAGSDPAGLAIDPAGRFLYVANAGSNNVSVYAIDSTAGTLTPIETELTGLSPQSVYVDPSGRFAYVTNSASHSVAVYAIDPTTGALSGQGTAATHVGAMAIAATEGTRSVEIVPRFAYIPSFVSDIVVAAVNPGSGRLTWTNNFVAGADPIDLVIHPSGRHAYVANSGTAIGNISMFGVNDNGELIDLGTVSAPGSPLAIGIEPSGRFAYIGSSDGLTRFRINTANGSLSLPNTTSAGTAFSVVHPDPNGRFIYAASGQTLYAFAFNSSGVLTPVGTPIFRGAPIADIVVELTSRFLYATHGREVSICNISSSGELACPTTISAVRGPGPNSLAVDSDGRFLYVADFLDGTLHGFSINGATGALRRLPGAASVTGAGPHRVSVDPSGRFVYTANINANTVSVFERTSTGSLNFVEEREAGTTPRLIRFLAEPQ